MSLTKKQLSYEIDELLSLPRMNKEGPAYNIVRIIIKTMISALQRGEPITIRGFGTFKIKEYPPRQHMAQFFYKHINSPMVTNLPARKRVVFTPAKSLKYMVNQDAD